MGPTHKGNVRAVAVADMALSEACQAEAALRDDLIQNSVPFTSWLRAMPLRGLI
jgi:hypothetical protein